MNTNENPVAFSDVLFGDERLINQSEQEFLAELLRRSENNSRESNLEITQAIARLAAEIVVGRAGALVGDCIQRRFTTRNSVPGQKEYCLTRSSGPGGPRPPTPTPPSPGPGISSAFDLKTYIGSLPGPRPPIPTPPAPGPGPGTKHTASPKGILSPDVVGNEFSPPKCVVLEEFLSPPELNDLLSYTLAHQEQFVVSEVISPGVNAGSAADFEYRRSHVLMDLGIHQERLISRLHSTLPSVLPRLGIEPFSISRIEAQITSSQDGDFFRWHSDNGQEEVAARQVTFVYFFHHEPKAFEGGELRIQGFSSNDSTQQPNNYYAIVPGQNQLVLFDSSLTHEIAPVKCSSGKFADSRFTVNGWLSR